MLFLLIPKIKLENKISIGSSTSHPINPVTNNIMNGTDWERTFMVWLYAGARLVMNYGFGVDCDNQAGIDLVLQALGYKTLQEASKHVIVGTAQRC